MLQHIKEFIKLIYQIIKIDTQIKLQNNYNILLTFKEMRIIL